jgi:hypothetical protein
MKDRVELHLDRDLNEWLSRAAQRPGSSKSAIVGDALRAFLERGAATEIEQRLDQRLRQLTALLRRIDRNVEIVLESQALFIRHQFSVIPPVAAADLAAARAESRDRFERFVDQVGRRLAQGKNLIRDAIDGASDSAEFGPVPDEVAD